jgi:predicted RNA-binding protein Jag
MGYSLQANRKTHEGSANHPDRDAQFQYINEQSKCFMQGCHPVISVDTKKKELVGNFKNKGMEWLPSRQPQDVNVYDFPSLADGKAIPYGVYDVERNVGWVNVGTDSDTPMFAVESIKGWWNSMGRTTYKPASKLLIHADSGGSNSARSRVWKKQLQELANQTGLSITVSHLPPGTSKWNKIEHRMFSQISINWRGKPLTSFETIINLIGATTTKKGLKIKANLDCNKYEKGIKVSDKEMKEVNLKRHQFHGEWNYTISPGKL